MEKKILIIDFIYPFPENIGRKMRTMNFVRFFKKYGTLDLLYFYDQSKEVDDPGIFTNEYLIQYRGYQEKKLFQTIKGRWKRILERRPWLIRDWPPNQLKKIIDIMMNGKYDIIFCRYILDTYPLFNLPLKLKKRVILDFDDIFSEGGIFDSRVKYGSHGYDKLRNNLQKYLLVQYEKKCLNFGAALFVSKYDLKKVAGFKETNNTFVVPNIYPANMSFDEECGDGYPKRNTYLFIGTLNYGPNIEGLKWFIDTVFKNGKNGRKNETLLVVGRNPSDKVVEICRSENNIELHSNVPDVKPYYEQCGIVVVPILTAGGTRIKILESGVAGRPVLSTPMGAFGLDVEDGKELLLFSDRNSFDESINKLNDKELYDSLIRNMKNLVKDLYSPDSFNAKMEEVIKSFL